jgi:Domain of unknown function (DUF4917)
VLSKPEVKFLRHKRLLGNPNAIENPAPILVSCLAVMGIITFEQALNETAHLKRHLLLGNGFSIALFPDRFRYGSLLDQADFTKLPEARLVFDAIGTTDFELVAQALKDTAAILPVYVDDAKIVAKIQEQGEALKELLVRAIAGSHPERPSDITEQQYKSCRTFLSHFVGASRVLDIAGKKKDLRGNVYTLNYDLLLYWTLLHNQIVNWNAENPLQSKFEETEELEHDVVFEPLMAILKRRT